MRPSSMAWATVMAATPSIAPPPSPTCSTICSARSWAAASPAAAHDLAEQIVEHVGEGGGAIEGVAAMTVAHAMLEGRMAEAVVRRALLIVLQDVIGFVEFLELAFGRVVALV